MARSAPSRTEASGTFEWTSRSVEETHAFGERLGAVLAAGDVVGFIGELGTGKTTLIQGVAKGLGIDPQRVKSPTFVLAREYAGRVPMTHLDGYRLEGESSVVWLDLEWMFSMNKITVIEWADRFDGCLPEDWLELRLSHKTTHHRQISVRAHGPRSSARLEAIRTTVAQVVSSTTIEPNESASEDAA